MNNSKRVPRYVLDPTCHRPADVFLTSESPVPDLSRFGLKSLELAT